MAHSKRLIKFPATRTPWNWGDAPVRPSLPRAPLSGNSAVTRAAVGPPAFSILKNCFNCLRCWISDLSGFITWGGVGDEREGMGSQDRRALSISRPTSCHISCHIYPVLLLLFFRETPNSHHCSSPLPDPQIWMCVSGTSKEHARKRSSPLPTSQPSPPASPGVSRASSLASPPPKQESGAVSSRP